MLKIVQVGTLDQTRLIELKQEWLQKHKRGGALNKRSNSLANVATEHSFKNPQTLHFCADCVENLRILTTPGGALPVGAAELLGELQIHGKSLV